MQARRHLLLLLALCEADDFVTIPGKFQLVASQTSVWREIVVSESGRVGHNFGQFQDSRQLVDSSMVESCDLTT